MNPSAPADQTAVHAPRLGPEGQRCRSCDAPLAVDQRYCLQCGARRAQTPLRFLDEPGTAAAVGGTATDIGAHPTPAGSPAPAANGAPSTPSPVQLAPERRTTTVAAVGVSVVLALWVGFLVGRGGDPGPQRPTVISVGGDGAATPAATAFVSDWPSGKEGYTIALQRFAKTASTPDQIAQAEREAVAKGAPAVGALDSDAYPSLDGGAYIIYSGVFATRADARAGLDGVQEAFPDASVVAVGPDDAQDAASDDGAEEPTSKARSKATKDPDAQTLSDDLLEQQQGADPEKFRESSKKLPDKVQSQGAPPPTDAKPAGGGSESETFG